ncbi:alpha/beta hydrolase [Streptomyces sp. NPDC001920]
MHLERAAACAGWPVPPANPQRPLQAHGAPAALVVNARYDVSTPYTQAKAVTAQLPGARLLTCNGAGHAVYGVLGSPCAKAITDGYLTTGRLPAAGADCPSRYPPASKPKPTPTSASSRPTHPPSSAPGAGPGRPSAT